MALTLLDSLGDWNPQLLRELKGRLKAPNVLVAVAISLLGQLLTFLYFFSYLPNSTSRSAGSAYCTGGDPNITVVYQCLRDAAGNIIIDWPRWWLEPFVFLSLIGIFALIVVGPYLLITDLAQEQRRGTLNLIRLSPQPIDKILVGKLLGVPILLYLVAVLAAPLHLWAGLSAGIPLGQILSFYLVLVASCGLFYSAAMLYSLTTTWLGILQALVGSGAIYIFLRSTDILLFRFSDGLPGPFNWLGLFSPATTIPFLEKSSPGMWIWLLGFSGANLEKLQWFHLPLGVNNLSSCIFLVLNYGLWTYWVWQSLRRCFRNPNTTLVSKRQSYGLILCLEVILVGFAFQDFSASSRLTSEGWLHSNFQLLFLNLLIFLGLMAGLTPQRQALQNWARYRRESSHRSRRLWSRTLVRDLIWGEKSPALLAIALNLAIAAAVIMPWVLLWPSGTDKGQMLVQLGLKLSLLLMYAAIVQLTVFMKNSRRVLWATGIMGAVILLPPILMVIGGRIELLSNLQFFAVFPLISLESVSATTVFLGFLGQWAITVGLTLLLVRQLRQAGASTSKALFVRS